MSNQPWFFAPPESWSDGTVVLPAGEAHHAARVVRVAPGDVITVFDGAGRVARCAAGAPEPDGSAAEVLEVTHHQRLRPRLVVYQGAAKGGKLDQVVEKLAELGVAEMHAFVSERAVARWDGAKAAKLAERWGAIARAASKQSRNPFLLEASAGLTFPGLLERVRAEPAAVTLWEEASLPLRTVLPEGVERVAVVIGPEGGLSAPEAEALADSGAPLASLGPRILRTETASVAVASALLFHYGLLG